MADFPTNIRTISKLTDLAPEDPAIRTEMENGMVQSRACFTRIRRSWTLSWNALEEADFQTVMEHYRGQKGGSEAFNWTHPLTKEQINVRYTRITDATTYENGYRSGFAVTLEEV